MRRSLTKEEILRKKKDIDCVFKEGRKIQLNGMKMIYLSNNLGFDRFLVVPAKHFGSSVERNLARRRAKEVFRNYPGRRQSTEKDKQTGTDFVLVIYPGKASSFDLIESEMLKGFASCRPE